MQWLVTLAQAYSLSGDERFAEGFVTSVRDFLRANPPESGSIGRAARVRAAYRVLVLGPRSPPVLAKITGDVTAEVPARSRPRTPHRALPFYVLLLTTTRISRARPRSFYAGVLLSMTGAGTPLAHARPPDPREGAVGRSCPTDSIFEQATCYQTLHRPRSACISCFLGRRAGGPQAASVGERYFSGLLDACSCCAARRRDAVDRRFRRRLAPALVTTRARTTSGVVFRPCRGPVLAARTTRGPQRTGARVPGCSAPRRWVASRTPCRRPLLPAPPLAFVRGWEGTP